jgi:hypothetical protein
VYVAARADVAIAEVIRPTASAKSVLELARTDMASPQPLSEHGTHKDRKSRPVLRDNRNKPRIPSRETY